MFCQQHQLHGLGNAVLAGAARCSNCELPSDADCLLCAACSIQLGRCQKCKAAVATGAYPALHMNIALWRWQMRKASEAIEADYARRDREAAANGAGPEATEKRKRDKAAKIRAAQLAFQHKVEQAQRLGVARAIVALAGKEVRSS